MNEDDHIESDDEDDGSSDTLYDADTEVSDSDDSCIMTMPDSGRPLIFVH